MTWIAISVFFVDSGRFLMLQAVIMYTAKMVISWKQRYIEMS